MFKNLFRLLKTQPVSLLAVPAASDDTIVIEADAAANDERLLGCGWFDSSHELTCGLVVTEHRSADAVADSLPLVDWIELQLSGWRAQLVAGVSVAEMCAG